MEQGKRIQRALLSEHSGIIMSNETVDMVNHPPHYTQGGIECIDAIEASLGDVGFRAFLKGNVTKYLWRYEQKKAPLQDLEKARWYLDRLIAALKA